METKPAYLTTEFWVTIFSTIYMVLNASGILNEIPPQWAAVATAILGGLYAVGRGQAKQGLPYNPPAK